MARKQSPTRVPVRVSGIVAAALDLLGYGLESAGIRATTDVPADLPQTMADPDQLTQVLVNLVENALRYTPEGGRVTVEVYESDGAAVVRVSDNADAYRASLVLIEPTPPRHGHVELPGEHHQDAALQRVAEEVAVVGAQDSVRRLALVVYDEEPRAGPVQPAQPDVAGPDLRLAAVLDQRLDEERRAEGVAADLD
jgi:hypothetical protein